MQPISSPLDFSTSLYTILRAEQYHEMLRMIVDNNHFIMHEGYELTNGMSVWKITCPLLDKYFHEMFQAHAYSGVLVDVRLLYANLNSSFGLESTTDVITQSLEILEKDLAFELSKQAKFKKSTEQFYFESRTGILSCIDTSDNGQSYRSSRFIKQFPLTDYVADAITPIYGNSAFLYENGSLTPCIRQQFISLAI